VLRSNLPRILLGSLQKSSVRGKTVLRIHLPVPAEVTSGKLRKRKYSASDSPASPAEVTSDKLSKRKNRASDSPASSCWVHFR